MLLGLGTKPTGLGLGKHLWVCLICLVLVTTVTDGETQTPLPMNFFFFFSWGVILIKPRHWLQMFVSSAVAGHCLMMILNKISETLRKHSSFFYPQVCWKGCLGSREAVSSEIFGGFQGYSVSHVPRLDCMSATISRGSPNTGTAFVLTASK